MLSYCLDFWVKGDIKPQGMRAFSVALHIFNSLALFFVLRKKKLIARFGAQPAQSGGKDPLDLGLLAALRHTFLRGEGRRLPNAWYLTLAAALFAAHPVHVENVVYLVGRADMMATAVWCLVFFIYLDSLNSRAMFPLIALLCLVAGFCKESGFMVIPFLVTVEVTRKNWNFVTGMGPPVGRCGIA